MVTFSDDLFNSILIRPVSKGCNKLFIVSGYATSVMASYHLKTLKNMGAEVDVELILGMTAKDGLSRSDHRGFQQLVTEHFRDVFKCSYAVKLPPIHSKVYAWLKDDTPMFGFAGSANYTQTAFNSQRELMVECSPEECVRYFNEISRETICCEHQDIEKYVTIYDDQTYTRLQKQKKLFEDREPPMALALQGYLHIQISLLDNHKRLPPRSGLNWGQRPECNREPNQAYIRLPSSVYRSDFFPKRGVHFTVITDDDEVLICTRAQDNGKAIHTPQNNSIMGKYFRHRLGLSSGAPIKKEDLQKYGRTHVDFYKKDNETYYMDFST